MCAEDGVIPDSDIDIFPLTRENTLEFSPLQLHTSSSDSRPNPELNKSRPKAKSNKNVDTIFEYNCVESDTAQSPDFGSEILIGSPVPMEDQQLANDPGLSAHNYSPGIVPNHLQDSSDHPGTVTEETAMPHYQNISSESPEMMVHGRQFRRRRGDVVGFLKRDQRLFGQYRVEEDTEDEDFDGLQETVTSPVPVPPSSSPQQYTHLPDSFWSSPPQDDASDNDGELHRRHGVPIIDSDFSGSESGSDLEDDTANRQLLQRRIRAPIPASARGLDFWVNGESQSQSQPLSQGDPWLSPFDENSIGENGTGERHGTNEEYFDREGEAEVGDHIDFMMSRSRSNSNRPRSQTRAKTGPGSQPSAFSVVELRKFAGSKASPALRVAARTAQRRNGGRIDDPDRKLVVGLGRGPQKALERWRRGELPRYNEGIQAGQYNSRQKHIHGDHGENSRQPKSTTRMRKTNLRYRPDHVSRSGMQMKLGQYGSNGHESTLRTASGQKRDMDSTSIPVTSLNSRSSGGENMHSTKRSKLASSHPKRKLSRRKARRDEELHYHTTMLEAPATLRVKRSRLALSPLRDNESPISDHEFGNSDMHDPSVVALVPQDMSVHHDMHSFRRSHLDGTTLYGSVTGSFSPHFVKTGTEPAAQPLSWNDIDLIASGQAGDIDAEMYNAIYDFFIDGCEHSTSYGMIPDWVGLLTTVQTHGVDRPGWTTQVRLLAAAAVLVVAPSDLEVDRLVRAIIFNHLNVLAMESGRVVSDPRATPGTELVLLAAAKGILAGLDELLLETQDMNLERRWQFVILVAAAGVLPPPWDAVRRLTTSMALSENVRLAMISYLRLAIEFDWGPSVEITVDCFNYFAKLPYWMDPHGEQLDLPEFLWRPGQLRGRGRPRSNRHLFLEVLGATLHLLRAQNRIHDCLRIASRVTPLARLRFPETAALEPSAVSTVALQYGILLVLMRECPPEAGRTVAQIRDLVALREAHICVRFQALSAWQVLVMIANALEGSQRLQKLIDCRQWLEEIITDAWAQVRDGEPNMQHVIARAAAVGGFVADRGALEAIPAMLFHLLSQEDISPRLRTALWTVPLAILGHRNTSPAMDILTSHLPNMRRAAQISENDMQSFVRIARALWSPEKPLETLEWSNDTTRLPFYLEMLPWVHIHWVIAEQALEMIVQPQWTESGKRFLTAVASELGYQCRRHSEPIEEDRLQLARVLLSWCASHNCAEVASRTLDRVRRHYEAVSRHGNASMSSYLIVGPLRRLIFEYFPNLRSRNNWFRGDDRAMQTETTHFYLWDASDNRFGPEAVTFFAYRLRRSLDNDGGDSFTTDLLEIISDSAIMLEAVGTHVLGTYFEVALTRLHQVQPVLWLLVHAARAITNLSDSLHTLPMSFIVKAGRFANFCVRASVPIDQLGMLAFLRELFLLGCCVVRQTSVSCLTEGEQSRYKSGDAVIVGLYTLAVKLHNRDRHRYVPPLDPDNSPVADDICSVFNGLDYSPPPCSESKLNAAICEFEQYASKYERFVGQFHRLDHSSSCGDCDNLDLDDDITEVDGDDRGGRDLVRSRDVLAWTDLRLTHGHGWRPAI